MTDRTSVTRRPPALDVRNLTVAFESAGGPVEAVSDVSFEVGRGEVVALVGESGSGKSTIALAIVGLLPPTARASGSILLGDGRDVVAMSEPERVEMRGGSISMVFQDPANSLNPLMKIGRQVEEALTAHGGMNRTDAKRRALHLIESVGIPDAPTRIGQYPHELSGGMCQRVMIAIALANRPELLIGDEPTTALDVTVQAQVMRLMREARRELDTSMLLISHDLGLVAGEADRVLVMYAGRIVEQSDVAELFAHPRNPYTHGLLGSVPDHRHLDKPLVGIPGTPPEPSRDRVGCPFSPRCWLDAEQCRTELPTLIQVGPDHRSRCHRVSDLVRELDGGG